MTPEHFTLHEVVPGVWGAESDFAGIAIGNAAIIDLGGKTVVVDTFMTDVAAAELRTAAEALTGNGVFLAVNTHWHGDHTSGNQVFGDVPIVSTRLTLDRLVETAPRDVAAWQEQIDRVIDRLQGAAQDDPAAARRLASQREFRSFTERFRLTLPGLLIEDRLVVEGERSAEIFTLGRGHTVSDIVVWLPHERVLVTGDLCWNRIHPRTQDGFPAEWAAYVSQLIDLDPAHVVPGHGEPGDGTTLADLPDYFTAVAALVTEVAAGADPGELEAPPGSEDWEGVERFRSGVSLLAGH